MQGSSREAAVAEIAFPEANTLVFENLPSLVSFSSGDLIVKWPSLENVTVTKCPKIKTVGLGHVEKSQLKSVDVKKKGQEEDDSETVLARLFQLSDILSSIREYDIDDAENLAKILAMNLQPSHFANLARLQAKHCDNRLNEFLTVWLKSKRLEHLTIRECKSLEHVFDLDTKNDVEGDGRYFAWLKTMILSDLPQLTCIWKKDAIGHFGLGCLEEIDIEKCKSLKNLIPASEAGNLKQLQVLRLHSCEMIEEVVAMETQGLETQNTVIEFPFLGELELMDLPKLVKFHRGNCPLEFPSMNCLRIKNCPQMMTFTAGFATAEELSITDKSSFTKLNELEFDTCGKLIYVMSSIMLPRFQNLEKLTVSRCDSLKEVIQFHRGFCSAEPMLRQLSELQLSHLPNLMHLISMEFESTKFFQNLKILRVKDCNSLKHLFLPFAADSAMLREIEISDCNDLEKIFVTKGEETNGKFLFSDLNSIALENLPKLSTFSLCTFEFPSVEILEITNCPALKTFVSGFSEMKDLPAASNNFFENFESFVKLKKLTINQIGAEKLWHNKYPSKSICVVEVLTLNKSNNLLNVIPSSMLIKFNKLKNFTVEGCVQLTEVFDLEDIPDHDATEILPELIEFSLICLPSLMNVWNKEPHVPVFQNLASLQIIECDGLTKLFSLSTAKYLQLNIYSNSNCSSCMDARI